MWLRTCERNFLQKVLEQVKNILGTCIVLHSRSPAIYHRTLTAFKSRICMPVVPGERLCHRLPDDCLLLRDPRAWMRSRGLRSGRLSEASRRSPFEEEVRKFDNRQKLIVYLQGGIANEPQSSLNFTTVIKIGNIFSYLLFGKLKELTDLKKKKFFLSVNVFRLLNN